jgi:hypothetical protein
MGTNLRNTIDSPVRSFRLYRPGNVPMLAVREWDGKMTVSGPARTIVRPVENVANVTFLVAWALALVAIAAGVRWGLVIALLICLIAKGVIVCVGRLDATLEVAPDCVTLRVRHKDGWLYTRGWTLSDVRHFFVNARMGKSPASLGMVLTNGRDIGLGIIGHKSELRAAAARLTAALRSHVHTATASSDATK